MWKLPVDVRYQKGGPATRLCRVVKVRLIAFNSSGKIGRQNKVATVTSNSIGTTNQVMIVANVLDKKL